MNFAKMLDMINFRFNVRTKRMLSITPSKERYIIKSVNVVFISLCIKISKQKAESVIKVESVI